MGRRGRGRGRREGQRKEGVSHWECRLLAVSHKPRETVTSYWMTQTYMSTESVAILQRYTNIRTPIRTHIHAYTYIRTHILISIHTYI